jgi:hypothetical protein
MKRLALLLLIICSCTVGRVVDPVDGGGTIAPDPDSKPDAGVDRGVAVAACLGGPGGCDTYDPPIVGALPPECKTPVDHCPPGALAGCKKWDGVEYYYNYSSAGPFALPDGGYLTDSDGAVIILHYGVWPPADCVDAGVVP